MPRTHSSTSIPYTAAPIHLILSDLALWLRLTFVLPPAGMFSIIFPIGPFNSGSLDELYPSAGNIWALTAHLVFLCIQAVFILSLVPSAFGLIPPWISGYTPAWLIYVIGFVLLTRLISRVVLNGQHREFISEAGLHGGADNFPREKWIFVNGVAAGNHWMQANLDRLSLTFRRRIQGIHNETRGILFDLIEVVLERTLGWATPSTRTVYARLLEIVSDDSYERVVLVLHSQGAVEGGLALDWLFATVPASLLGRVEVYTFGAAANHFNNPSFRTLDDAGSPLPLPPGANEDGRILKYVEHYANDKDYVAQFGILNFRPRPGTSKGKGLWDPIAGEQEQNMFSGRLFIRKAYGHQFNNNYLDNLFTFSSGSEEIKVDDDNDFMNSVFDETLLDLSDIVAISEDRELRSRIVDGTTSPAPIKSQGGNGQSILEIPARASTRRIKDVSRLWEYRNGGVPDDKNNHPESK